MSFADEPYTQRGCPACGSREPQRGWQVSSAPPAEEVPFAKLKASWRGFFKEGKLFFSYRHCSSCGQTYAPRYFTGPELEELYGQMEDNTAGVAEAVLARTQRGYADLLAPDAATIEGGYLELGPDLGLFTREAMQKKAFTHYWMVEPNTAVHPALEQLLRGKKYEILRDEKRLAEIEDDSLSLVVAIHVLDHLLEPQPLLHLLSRKLRRGGLILLVTHNQESLMARIFGRRWPAYCLQHPQLYAPASLGQSLKRAGFAHVQVQRTKNYFPVMYLARHLLFALGLKQVALPEWPAWTIGLKLGNIAAVGRRR